MSDGNVHDGWVRDGGPAGADTLDSHDGRRRSGLRPKAGVLLGLGGAAVGAILATTLSAGAATNGSTTAPTPNAPHGYRPGYGPGPGGWMGERHGGRHGFGLDLTGTVVSKTASTVTIKTGSGTTTYRVTSSSDIDKNGEASLAALVAGDAVRFNTTGSGSSLTIDKLHAGDESKNMPAHPDAPPPAPSGSESSA